MAVVCSTLGDDAWIQEEVLSNRTLCPVRFEEAGVPKEPTEKDQLNLHLEPTGNLDVLGGRAGGITQGKSNRKFRQSGRLALEGISECINARDLASCNYLLIVE